MGLSGGMVRDVVVPQELIDNGTYVNPTGEYKLTHCWNECDNTPCEIIYDSWVNVQILTDNYPEETSWKITPLGGQPVLLSSEPEADPNTFYEEEYLPVPEQIVVEIEDSYGDGLGASQWGGTDGWFLVKNSCQDTILFVEGNFGSLYIDTLTIAPCAPPIEGCMDPNALNYDSLAVIGG